MPLTGFQVAKITSATAIQPWPAVMVSIQVPLYPSERYAPESPTSAPPIIVYA